MSEQLNDIAWGENRVQITMTSTISYSWDWDGNNLVMILHDMALAPCHYIYFDAVQK